VEEKKGEPGENQNTLKIIKRITTKTGDRNLAPQKSDSVRRPYEGFKNLEEIRNGNNDYFFQVGDVIKKNMRTILGKEGEADRPLRNKNEEPRPRMDIASSEAVRWDGRQKKKERKTKGKKKKELGPKGRQRSPPKRPPRDGAPSGDTRK